MIIRPLLSISLLLFAGPTAAWEFRPSPICILAQETAEADVTVTYDARLPEYAIILTLKQGRWDTAPIFSITFEGVGMTISTDRHEITDGGSTLAVRDAGFGNVLNGLEFADRAVAVTGGTALSIPLDRAAPQVALFRDCPQVLSS